MGFIICRHKSRLNAMFPKKEATLLFLIEPCTSYAPFPDRLSRFLAYLMVKPHKIKKSAVYLLHRFEKSYFYALDYVACFVTLGVVEEMLLHLPRYISSFSNAALSILLACIAAFEISTLQTRAMEIFSLFCRVIGSTSKLKQLGFSASNSKLEKNVPPSLPKKRPWPLPPTKIDFDTLLVPFENASIFYTIVSLLETMSMGRLPSLGRGSSLVLGELRKKVRKRENEFKNSIFSEALKWKFKPLDAAVEKTAVAAFSAAIQAEDWPSLLHSWSNTPLSALICELYFSDTLILLPKASARPSSPIRGLMERLAGSFTLFLALLQYLFARLCVISLKKKVLDTCCNTPTHAAESIIEKPQITQEHHPNNGGGNFPKEKQNGCTEESFRNGNIIKAPAFALRPSEMDPLLLQTRLAMATMEAPLCILEWMNHCALQTADVTMLAAAIEKLRAAINSISLCEENGLSMTGNDNATNFFCKSEQLEQHNLQLVGRALFSLLCQLVTGMSDITALAPGLIKTCITQQIRVARLEEEPLFIFDGSLSLLKSDHPIARLVTLLLSAVLGHNSVSTIRDELYSSMVSRLIICPTLTSSSSFSGSEHAPLNLISGKHFLEAFMASNATSKKISKLPQLLLRLKLSRDRLFPHHHGK